METGCEACAIAEIEKWEIHRLLHGASLFAKFLPLAMQLRAKIGDLFNELGHNHGPLSFMPELRKRFRCSLFDQVADLLDS